MKKVTTLYFVEGECEENFIHSFKAKREIFSGKVQKTNLWEITNINRILRSLPREKSNIYVVFDTDVLTSVDRFCKNIHALSKHARSIVLLPQHEHFEDEIAFACGQMASRDIPAHLYRLSSISECKTKLAQDKNLVNNLRSKGFDLSAMWARTDIEKQLSLPSKNVSWGIVYVLAE